MENSAQSSKELPTVINAENTALMKFDSKLKFLPSYLIELLKETGYYSESTLLSINEKDIEGIENFAREQLHLLVDKKDYIKYYGPLFSKKPEIFKILGGFKKQIFELSQQLQRETKAETPNDGGGDGTDNRPINGEPELACIVQDQEMEEDEARSETTFQYSVKKEIENVEEEGKTEEEEIESIEEEQVENIEEGEEEEIESIEEEEEESEGENEEEHGTLSTATFRYTVKNVSKMKDSQLSPACYVRNLPWKIMVMPRSSQTEEKQPQRSLGFYLQCNGESESTSWNCYAVVELRLLACKEGIEPFSRKTQHLFCSEMNDWGFSQFMTWEDVLDPDRGFIKDDSITLEVYVKADAPHGVS